MKLTRKHRWLLAILAGCPDGATEPALTAKVGARLEWIEHLVRHGLAERRITQVAARGSSGPALAVARLYITDAGRRVITP